jgi:hypothetical protein
MLLMSSGDIIREFRNLPELVEALREVVRLRNTTFASVDELGGLPAGYASKVLGPRPIKQLGKMSLECILGAPAVKCMIVTDDEQLARLEGRMHQRTNMGATMLNAGVHFNVSRRFYREIGRKAAAARMVKLTPRERRRIARRAARARWSRRAVSAAG